MKELLTKMNAAGVAINIDVLYTIVDTKAMQASGFSFYLSVNNVWLTTAVPVQFILVS